ncbi:hypothetical protein BT93_D1329 [Corymbia citriodora subsp. variegata]|nr:hypothetical protein BT93_D1329 [Corymbia citriodora subsp. variegata]
MADLNRRTTQSSSFSASSHPGKSDGSRGESLDVGYDRERTKGRGRGRGGAGKDRIDALGRLLTRILRHMAAELNLNMRSDGYVKVQDLLQLNIKTSANVPLRVHTVDEIKEVCPVISIVSLH